LKCERISQPAAIAGELTKRVIQLLGMISNGEYEQRMIVSWWIASLEGLTAIGVVWVHWNGS
jgi:hypothetical protein